eukprot:TRINITY_DN12163_c0_g3_i2.p1 TRINITY_DN12163_c0_g3~~TRINITY_DN12163_c0_g3_i2.p1  ORF type:complete len:479 (+),score=154.68 TRINITY_DN12163_c0_g3_i2:91-1527(+)
MEQGIKLNELPDFAATQSAPISFDWKVSPNTFVHTNMLLGSFQTPQGSFNIVSHLAGTVKSLPKDSSDPSPIEVTECDHDMSYGDICLYCGEVPKDVVHKSYCGFDSKASFSLERALEEEKKYMQKLSEEKKLILVLDIDHTLVHTCSGNLINPDAIDDYKKLADESGSSYFIKFRPFLQTFLKDINPFFDTYIYSHGSQKYANQVAELIDPEETTIKKQRVLGREEKELDLKQKNLENLLPADQSASIIIDDRNDVWANKKNLIMIFPFVYFDSEVASYDRSMYPKLPAKSQDCSLFYFGKLLRNINSLFYDTKKVNGADVRSIIAFVRAFILKSVTVSLELLGKPQETLPKCAEYKMATEMGALITNEITDNTITLLWKYKEVKMVEEAEKKGAKLVDLHWLILSSRYWHKLPIEPFIISKDNPKAKFTELKIAEEMEKKLEKEWKYEHYDEILNGLLENEQNTGKSSVKKRKIDA